jgi:glucuronate isomerase
MKQFMDENFLLHSKTAEKLYHEYAKAMPIFDYHCHLSPREIAENKRYKNITEVWLGGDHYKWRAMRINGVDERYITGEADDKEKFLKWAETMPQCIGNPLYHWTHMELKAYFGIDKLLSPDTAEEIWERCNASLQKEEFSVRELIKRSNVKVLCTTDDPADTLNYHAAIEKDTSFGVKVLPAFRPDRILNIDKDGFTEYLGRLGKTEEIEIKSFADLLYVLKARIEYFHSMGCRISDHALDAISFTEAAEEEADAILHKSLNGEKLSDDEISRFKTQVLLFLGRQYARLGWTMQIHLSAMRNNNSRMMKVLGPDTGFDTIGDNSLAYALSRFLDSLDRTDELPKTILYCLNPRDNEVIAAITGCFQDGRTPGKIQFGSGWWFNDQKDGITRQMTALANIGLLSRFIGMITDSRSFLSYTRHEYFRRILCNLIGEWVEKGEAPDDMDLLGRMVQNISFNNARDYFGIPV